ncbi:MAG: transcriptional regulator [Firmicutes bacterium HGW-Firmicutes-15]|nr:MAG: transcriptional regulator [Firmicutes bacterium HGW-Firmicutes-15]
MNKSIADRIEQYIKVLIARSTDRQIEIQRAELAETFSCVPSQVTYVLRTRFTEKDGYYKESRRGGRGYVRITELQQECGGLLGSNKLIQFINQLSTEKLLNERETAMIKHIIINAGNDLPLEYRIRVNEGIAVALRQFLEIN